METTHSKRDALDFYIPAKGFKESAKCIHVSPYADGREGLIFLPMQTLIGFSLELYFKALLAHAGVDEGVLRREYGHDLQKLFEDCTEAGLPEITRLNEVVEATSGSHSDYTYRYFSRNRSYTAMGLGTTFPVLDHLDEAVDRAIGASASSGKSPGH